MFDLLVGGFFGFVLGWLITATYFWKYDEAIRRGIRDAERQYLTQAQKDNGVYLVPLWGGGWSFREIRR
jgi:hypothetical protein